MKITRLTCTLLLGCLGVVACSSTPERGDVAKKPAATDAQAKQSQLSEQDLRQEADTLYRHARKSLDSGEYSTAVTDYDKLIARYPFTEYGTQAELEKIFALYKTYQYDEALSSADRFLRDHPRHPKADYVQYLKGLINFERDIGILDSLPIDGSKRDVTNERLSYNDFALLALKYPNSRYIADARLRMIWLRNRVAQHELSIVHFYVKRGAYIAAAKRAEAIVAEYPGAPATGEALQILERCYRKAGLTHEADDMAKLIAANPAVLKPVNAKPVRSETVAAADASAAAPEPVQPAPETAESHGFFSWFAGLFSFLDTTRPENIHQIIIPTHHDEGASASTPAGQSAAEAPAQAGNGGNTAPQGGATTAAPAADGGKLKSHGLRITAGPEPGDEWHPIDTPAAATAPPPAQQAAPSDASTAATGGTSASGPTLRFSDSLSHPQSPQPGDTGNKEHPEQPDGDTAQPPAPTPESAVPKPPTLPQ
jgi:outer membrane protein assembly factor BamD